MKLPQKCPSEKCNADLRDPDLPPEMEKHRDLFSLVQLVSNVGQKSQFRCPVCSHVWVVGSTKKRSRSGNPARRLR